VSNLKLLFQLLHNLGNEKEDIAAPPPVDPLTLASLFQNQSERQKQLNEQQNKATNDMLNRMFGDSIRTYFETRKEDEPEPQRIPTPPPQDKDREEREKRILGLGKRKLKL